MAWFLRIRLPDYQISQLPNFNTASVTDALRNCWINRVLADIPTR